MNRNESTSVQKSTLREAAQQALEALEEIADEVFSPYDNKLGDAILALRAALAEPVQEPVYEHEKWCASVTQLLLCNPPRKAPCNCKPTAPPQRKPLTEEEIERLLSKHEHNYEMIKFARAIERAHGIGEKE